MGGVDDMCDRLGLEVGHQPGHAAKPADAGGQGLGHGAVGAPGIGKHRVDLGFDQGARQGAGFGGATQKKDAHNG